MILRPAYTRLKAGELLFKIVMINDIHKVLIHVRQPEYAGYWSFNANYEIRGSFS
jgi:hypothetical protein